MQQGMLFKKNVNVLKLLLRITYMKFLQICFHFFKEKNFNLKSIIYVREESIILC